MRLRFRAQASGHDWPVPKAEHPRMRARVLTSCNLRSGSAASEVGRNEVQSVAATAIVLLLGVTSGVIAARGLGVAGRGQLTAVVLWAAVLTALVELGLPTAFTYLSASRAHARFDLAKSILLLHSTLRRLAHEGDTDGLTEGHLDESNRS